MPASSGPPVLQDPDVHVTDPGELLTETLDWCRDGIRRKLDGLTDAQLRTPVEPMGWSPLGLVQHLGWVERRWMRWGFAAEDAVAYADSDAAEWSVPLDVTSASVLASWADEVRLARELADGVDIATPARLGGRFPTTAEAPSLGRILTHLLQEYARHLGHLDIVRELIDGTTGE